MNTRRVPRNPRTVAFAILIAVPAVLSMLFGALATPAEGAAGAPSFVGHLARAYQHRDGSVSVVGYAYDRADPSAHPRVCLAVAGRCVSTVLADQPSPGFDRARHITGPHRFVAVLGPGRPAERIAERVSSTVLDAVDALSPGARAVRLAKKYVGARYTEGGASPRTGFDCSGYTLYVYEHADVATLPHLAQAQRYVRHMHRISRSQALPGDLIFYLSGGSAYHVAIYAGHGYQYAAATPSQGVRYQPIWSSSVVFSTDWH